MDRKQQILKWFDKERKKDQLEIDFSKKKIIQQIKGLNKEELFAKPEPKKISLWSKIKTIIWGS